MNERITVLIADDNKDFCDIIGQYLSKHDDIEVVGVAHDGVDTLNQIRRYQPDVVVLDIIMPLMDGLGVLEKLNHESMENFPKIIILSAVGQDKITQRAIALGADYYIVKPFDMEVFVKRIRELVSDEFGSPDTSLSASFLPNENKITDQTLRLVWIGRTSGSAARGVGCLAASINMLRKKGIPIEAKIIGNPIGPNLHGLEYHGWIHDPLPILQWSSIAYGRGRSLREAMSCGNAGFLLAEGYGGLVTSKWFEHGRQPQLSGSLKHGCAELDPIQIAKDMLYFHKNRESLQAAGVEARKIAEDYFDIRKMAAETKKLYEEALY
jgi:DNA-binding NarL/FixJ family response regulator